MSKPKYSVEEKIKAAERYLCGESSAAKITAEMKMSKRRGGNCPNMGCDIPRKWRKGFQLTRGNNTLQK